MHSIENERRSLAAESTLTSFAALRGELGEMGGLGRLAEQNVVDLIADLAHFCEARGIDFEKCLRLARAHYAAER